MDSRGSIYIRIAFLILSFFRVKVAVANLLDFKECIYNRLPSLQILQPNDIRPRWNTYKAPSFLVAVKPENETEISIVVREVLMLRSSVTVF